MQGPSLPSEAILVAELLLHGSCFHEFIAVARLDFPPKDLFEIAADTNCD